MLDFLYEVRERDSQAFGNAWCGPKCFDHYKEALVARYPGEGDGQTVEVYCRALPARFYTLKVLAGQNSVGDPKAAYQLCTGSDMGEFSAELAKHISQGMIGLKSREPTAEASA